MIDILYPGRSEEMLFQFDNKPNALIHTPSIVGEGPKAILYPNDFTSESNIRSTESVVGLKFSQIKDRTKSST